MIWPTFESAPFFFFFFFGFVVVCNFAAQCTFFGITCIEGVGLDLASDLRTVSGAAACVPAGDGRATTLEPSRRPSFPCNSKPRRSVRQKKRDEHDKRKRLKMKERDALFASLGAKALSAAEMDLLKGSSDIGKKVSMKAELGWRVIVGDPLSHIGDWPGFGAPQPRFPFWACLFFAQATMREDLRAALRFERLGLEHAAADRLHEERVFEEDPDVLRSILELGAKGRNKRKRAEGVSGDGSGESGESEDDGEGGEDGEDGGDGEGLEAGSGEEEEEASGEGDGGHVVEAVAARNGVVGVGGEEDVTRSRRPAAKKQKVNFTWGVGVTVARARTPSDSGGDDSESDDLATIIAAAKASLASANAAAAEDGNDGGDSHNPPQHGGGSDEEDIPYGDRDPEEVLDAIAMQDGDGDEVDVAAAAAAAVARADAVLVNRTEEIRAQRVMLPIIGEEQVIMEAITEVSLCLLIDLGCDSLPFWAAICVEPVGHRAGDTINSATLHHSCTDYPASPASTMW